ncbi:MULTISPECIES: NUDIX domain-containing protein [Actinomadura]|uniref:NUDIX domain-containing protein n=1 Tax=Actinomadura litoris TaxID=2678616 RepID=A0A7K1LCV9_9ACTN|nr:MULTISPECIES: NUDIX hydrolase [Actinomadura]MBT2213994.1 NUDIX hydrolase [Actinomadura sp. NEAU-AAG7]MUN42261.1 NUDIX domain-containing protein [Actinomadura litoris]
MPSVKAGAPGPLTAGSPVRLQFAQKAFIEAHGRLLLVRKSADDPFHPGRWEVPGGRLEVEDDLDLDDHVRREVWEEVGLKIDPGPPFHLWQWFMPDRGARARNARIRVVATARRCRPLSLDADLGNQEPGDHLAECAWVPLAEVAGYALIPSLRPVMRAYLSRSG